MLKNRVLFQGMEPKVIKEETVEKDTTNYVETATNNIRTTRSKSKSYFVFLH